MQDPHGRIFWRLRLRRPLQNRRPLTSKSREHRCACRDWSQTCCEHSAKVRWEDVLFFLRYQWFLLFLLIRRHDVQPYRINSNWPVWSQHYFFFIIFIRKFLWKHRLRQENDRQPQSKQAKGGRIKKRISPCVRVIVAFFSQGRWHKPTF